MNERANKLIKSIPDLKYDASTGMFETDRRALYDLVELTVRECCQKLENDGMVEVAMEMKEHFGVEE
jgi:hypothetical protein